MSSKGLKRGKEPDMTNEYEDFAKLYRFNHSGQVLVTLDTNEELFPEIKVRLSDRGGLTPEVTLKGWSGDVDEAWDIAEDRFALIDEAKAFEIATDIVNTVDDMLKGD